MSCASENVDGARFCNECVTSLQAGCSACGAVNRSGARFCNECGNTLTGGAR
ncbi:MAG: zinc ribbon domain-containing protein [Chloroflexi bacterium]|nr:zinc ribbon domain-containing protein [Chloroflexota bacterium]